MTTGNFSERVAPTTAGSSWDRVAEGDPAPPRLAGLVLASDPAPDLLDIEAVSLAVGALARAGGVPAPVPVRDTSVGFRSFLR